MALPNQSYFELRQTYEIAEAFSKYGVEFLFLGKGGAIILGYPGATQDVDLFPKKSPENAEGILKALSDLNFPLTEAVAQDIRSGKDFVQIKNGPYELDLIFAPDGIESFDAANSRRHLIDGLPVANIRDIIASKKAANREKDLVDLPLLEDFLQEFEKTPRGEPKTAVEIALERLRTDGE